MFEVEKDVPVPTKIRGGRNSSNYPWATMEVGDSFYCPTEVKSHLSVRAAMTNANKRFAGERTFVAKRDAEGIRVWRKA